MSCYLWTFFRLYAKIGLLSVGYGFLFIIQTHGSTPLCSCLCYCLKISNWSQQNVAVKADYLPSSLTYHRLLCFEKKNQITGFIHPMNY